MEFAIVVWSIDGIIWLCCGLVVYRTRKVGKLRSEIINKIFNFYDVEWRISEYNKVTFGQMVLSVKPIKAESFYKDLSFLEPAKGPVISPFQPVR